MKKLISAFSLFIALAASPLMAAENTSPETGSATQTQTSDMSQQKHTANKSVKKIHAKKHTEDKTKTTAPTN